MIEKLKTYVNRNGYPMIRRCINCKHWKERETNTTQKKTGLCTREKLYFAFTLEPNVYAITMEYYLCHHHEFNNELELAEKCEQVNLIDILKKKQDIL